MQRCYQCQAELQLPENPGPKDRCPRCQKPLHCCFNCRYYSPAARQQCRVPDPEEILDKKQANACKSFEIRDFHPQRKDSPQDTAKKKIDDLFRNL